MDFVAILAGGAGTRFWPKSRARRPKQFLSFGSGGPLLAETFARTKLVAPPSRTLVVTGAEHVDAAARLLPELPRGHVVGEPAGRDTAAAIGLAALLVSHPRGLSGAKSDASLLVCPADHVISPPARFAAAARAADELLARHPERIVVFGLRPGSPATGYGYVEQGAPLGGSEGLEAFEVARFHEKPTLEKAREYVASGRFLWNAGIFAFRASSMLAEIAGQMPELARALDEAARSLGTARFDEELARVWATLPKKSIDHGVMEGARRRAVIVPDYEWDDVGSFAAVARARKADAAGNVAIGGCVALDSHGNVVDAGEGLVALIGVDDLVVVHTDDVTLVCRKERSEDVKKLLDEVKRRGGLDRHL
jgi:mannose-1-phosphate guanylyltransferase